MAKLNNTLPERRILRRQHVELRTGLSRSTLYQWIREGRFPPPVPLGRRAVGWDSAAIDQWLEEHLNRGGRA